MSHKERRQAEKILGGSIGVSAEPMELIECTDSIMVLSDEGPLTGAAARQARKQRLEVRESARLERVSQRVAARRAFDTGKGQGTEDEAARVQRVAQKAAARRARLVAKGEATDHIVHEGTEGNKTEEEVTQVTGEDKSQMDEQVQQEAPETHPKEQQAEETKQQEKREKRLANKAQERREKRLADKAAKRRARREESKKYASVAQSMDSKSVVHSPVRESKRSSIEESERATDNADHRPSRAQKVKAKDQSSKSVPQEAKEAERRKKRSRAPAGENQSASQDEDDSASSGSESSQSSSSSPSSPSPRAMAIAKALATGAPIPTAAAVASKNPCFAWERAIGPIASHLPSPQSAIFNPVLMPAAPQSSTQETELFLAAGGVDGEAALRLRALPPHLQRVVIERGPVTGTRNPSSVVISRIREVEMGRLTPGVAAYGVASFAPMFAPNPVPNPEVEKFITKYNLDAQAASMLRKLPLDQQRLALEMPIQEARNPSAFVMTQLSLSRGLLGMGEASRYMQSRDPTSMMFNGHRF